MDKRRHHQRRGRGNFDRGEPTDPALRKTEKKQRENAECGEAVIPHDGTQKKTLLATEEQGTGLATVGRIEPTAPEAPGGGTTHGLTAVRTSPPGTPEKEVEAEGHPYCLPPP